MELPVSGTVSSLTCQNLLINAERVLGVEGRVAGQHLVYEDAERPPVHTGVVALGLDDLRRQVLRGPAQGPRPVRDLLGEPEVSYYQMSLLKDSVNSALSYILPTPEPARREI